MDMRECVGIESRDYLSAYLVECLGTGFRMVLDHDPSRWDCNNLGLYTHSNPKTDIPTQGSARGEYVADPRRARCSMALRDHA